MKTDTQVIAICEQLLFIEREEAALVEHDEYAPEKGSTNYVRYQALLAERSTLLAALAKAPQPRTLKGIRALAEVAMTFLDAERSPESHRFAPGDIYDWVNLHALTSAAGRREIIPLPEYLSDYWPV